MREGVEGALGEQDQPDLESGLALAYDGCSEQVSGRESGRLTQSSDPGLDWLHVGVAAEGCGDAPNRRARTRASCAKTKTFPRSDCLPYNKACGSVVKR